MGCKVNKQKSNLKILLKINCKKRIKKIFPFILPLKIGINLNNNVASVYSNLRNVDEKNVIRQNQYITGESTVIAHIIKLRNL